MLAILQIILTSRFSIYLPLAAIIAGYSLAASLMGILSIRFFSWFRANKSTVVLLYALSCITIATNLVSTLIYVCAVFPIHISEVRPHTSNITPYRPADSIISTLNSIYTLTSISSFIITWIATAVLLRHYTQSLGRIKYLTIIVVPLAYFLIQFQPILTNLLSRLSALEPVLATIIFTAVFTFSKPIGGILFGIAFWGIVKRLKSGTLVRDYFIISAFGFVLLFVSNQAIVLVTAAYPPFGLVAVTFIGLSSFLLLIGIYSSAISMSEDIKIRQLIHKSVEKESKLLDSIGSSQMEQELQKRVLNVMKNQEANMAEETGIQSSMSEEDVKSYFYEALREIKRKEE